MNFPVSAYAVCLPPAEGECLNVTFEPTPSGDFAAVVDGHAYTAAAPELALCKALCQGGYRGYKPVAVGATFEGGGQIIGGSGWVTIVDSSGIVVSLSAEEKAEFAESGFAEAFERAAEILGRANQ